MNREAAEAIVRRYVAGWLAGDSAAIINTLDPDCVIIESQGATYRGRALIAQWIDGWLHMGSRVDQWDIKSLYIDDETVIFEWVFGCTISERYRRFDGVSVVQMRNAKIVLLHEYRMTAAQYLWSG